MADITGTDKADTIRGTEGDDNINSLGGRDDVKGLGGNDQINGGANRDVLDGGKGNDTIKGEGSNDKLVGNVGDDSLDGGGGDDILIGGAGSDLLRGGNGNDTLYGGQTARGAVNGADDDDTFVFDNNDGNDKIFDFQDNIDTIYLEGASSRADFTVSAFGSGSQIKFGQTTITVYGVKPGAIEDDIQWGPAMG